VASAAPERAGLVPAYTALRQEGGKDLASVGRAQDGVVLSNLDTDCVAEFGEAHKGYAPSQQERPRLEPETVGKSEESTVQGRRRRRHPHTRLGFEEPARVTKM